MGKFATLLEKPDAESTNEGREDRSEHIANHLLSGGKESHLARPKEKDHAHSAKHHIYVKLKDGRKNIAGPFQSKEEAEKHPARKWADGVHSE